MRTRDIDTLPPTARDESLEFAGFHGMPARCRFRLYHTTTGEPIIVLTEIPENEGTSVTNAAERCQYLAWERIGKPWPARFAEHYPGRDEHLDWVTFHGTGGDGPIVEPRWMHAPHAQPCFREAEWRPLPMEEFRALVGAEEGAR